MKDHSPYYLLSASTSNYQALHMVLTHDFPLFAILFSFKKNIHIIVLRIQVLLVYMEGKVFT